MPLGQNFSNSWTDRTKLKFTKQIEDDKARESSLASARLHKPLQNDVQSKFGLFFDISEKYFSLSQ